MSIQEERKKLKHERLLLPLYVALWQISYVLKIDSWIIIGIALLFALPFYRRFLGDRRIWYNVMLVPLFIGMLVLPGVLTHEIFIESKFNNFYEDLARSILFSISLVPISFGVLLNSHKIRVSELIIGALSYVLVVIPVTSFLYPQEIPKLLLFDVSFYFAVGFFVELLYISSNKKCMTPLVFFASFSVFSFLGVTVKVSDTFYIVWEILSVSISVWILMEMDYFNPALRRLLKGRKKVKLKHKASVRDYAFGVVILVFVFILIGGYYTHTVSGDPTGSMYPVITPGSLLIVEPVNPQSLKLGDIIEFHAPWANGTLYAHEIVNTEKVGKCTYFRTRGVANPVDDPQWVPQKDVIGLVVMHIPYLGYPIIYGDATAASLFLILIGLYLFDTFKKR